MTTAPTPQPPDHGAAGFCTDHGQPPVERTETVARVLLACGRIDQDGLTVSQQVEREWADSEAREIALMQAAAVVAALGDESARLRVEVERLWAGRKIEQNALRNALRAINSLTDDLVAARAALDRVRALADLMAHGPDRSGEPPLVTQAWTHAADAIRAALGPRDRRTFARCGFAESHEPHADRDTYCDGSSAALDPEEPR